MLASGFALSFVAPPSAYVPIIRMPEHARHADVIAESFIEDMVSVAAIGASAVPLLYGTANIFRDDKPSPEADQLRRLASGQPSPPAEPPVPVPLAPNVAQEKPKEKNAVEELILDFIAAGIAAAATANEPLEAVSATDEEQAVRNIEQPVGAYYEGLVVSSLCSSARVSCAHFTLAPLP